MRRGKPEASKTIRSSAPGGRVGARSPANHAIAHALLLEIDAHLHIVLAEADQFLITPRPRSSPERPGDGVQDRRLADAVGAGQASQLNAREKNRFGRAKGEEVAQF